MIDLKSRILDYFSTYLDTHETSPACDLHRHPVIGRALEDRVQRLLAADPTTVAADPIAAPDIKATLCHLRTPDNLLAVAVYPSGPVWWLDDSRYDDDFVAFARREKLRGWLPQRTHRLAELLVATKFASTMHPRLVTSADEVGADPSLEIAPPHADETDDAATLRFWLWTQSQGLLFMVQCYFRFDGSFYYEMLEKAQQVGAYTPEISF